VADLQGRLPKDQYYSWLNHYSPKHDRCFITLGLGLKLSVVNPMHTDVMYSGTAELVTELQDAFERRTVASIERPNIDWEGLRIGALAHKADPARTLTHKLANGKSMQWEIPTPEQQIARQIRLRRVTDPNATERRCVVEDEDVDCDKAAAFIVEHMNN
jgi:hypothetical protein